MILSPSVSHKKIGSPLELNNSVFSIHASGSISCGSLSSHLVLLIEAPYPTGSIAIAFIKEFSSYCVFNTAVYILKPFSSKSVVLVRIELSK